MDQVNEAARIDRELEEAQRDLRRTLEQVNTKVERAGGRLRPQALIRSNTFACLPRSSSRLFRGQRRSAAAIAMAGYWRPVRFGISCFGTIR
jgi:hypothetical protein